VSADFQTEPEMAISTGNAFVDSAAPFHFNFMQNKTKKVIEINKIEIAQKYLFFAAGRS
jgi:hypothetical protein